MVNAADTRVYDGLNENIERVRRLFLCDVGERLREMKDFLSSTRILCVVCGPVRFAFGAYARSNTRMDCFQSLLNVGLVL